MAGDLESNDEVYDSTVRPLVSTVLDGGNATCFAYGQTGSGKTHTMTPLPRRACESMLSLLASSGMHSGITLHVSYFEIYGGKLHDLLNRKRKLVAREDGSQRVVVVGLTEVEVCDPAQLDELIARGSIERSVGSTGANEESSRSHAIMQLALKRRLPPPAEPQRRLGRRHQGRAPRRTCAHA